MNKFDTKALVDEFSDYLQVQRAVSDNTLSSYQADLRQFLEYLDKEQKRVINFKGVTEKKIREELGALLSTSHLDSLVKARTRIINESGI